MDDDLLEHIVLYVKGRLNGSYSPRERDDILRGFTRSLYVSGADIFVPRSEGDVYIDPSLKKEGESRGSGNIFDLVEYHFSRYLQGYEKMKVVPFRT